MPRRKKQKSSKPTIHGAFARNYPRSVKWAVDQDYLSQLSREEMEWLAAFNDRHYGAKFHTALPEGFEEWSPEERRVAYRAKNTANDDAYAKCPEEQIAPLPRSLATQPVDPAHFDTDPDARPPVEVPEYLDSPEYRAALEAYRQNLTPTRRFVAPTPSRALDRARKNLEKVVRDAQAEED